MSIGKIACLLLYAVLLGLVFTMGDPTAGTVALWTLALLVVAHLIEMVLYVPIARRAGGSLAGHMVQFFLFGIVHKKELEASLAGQ